jgi:hypothetical protein
LVDCGILVFVDSTGNPDDREDIPSPVISLDRTRAVLIEAEETIVDADGDSGPVIGMVSGCWSMSGLGSAYGLILPVLLIEGWIEERHMSVNFQ